MMKVRMKVGAKDVVLLGLSHANLDRLREDGLSAAIQINGEELGLGADLWITAAETEAVMFHAFQSDIGPDTKVHIDKRFKQS